jgi:hypothetical protein
MQLWDRLLQVSVCQHPEVVRAWTKLHVTLSPRVVSPPFYNLVGRLLASLISTAPKYFFELFFVVLEGALPPADTVFENRVFQGQYFDDQQSLVVHGLIMRSVMLINKWSLSCKRVARSTARTQEGWTTFPRRPSASCSQRRRVRRSFSSSSTATRRRTATTPAIRPFAERHCTKARATTSG